MDQNSDQKNRWSDMEDCQKLANYLTNINYIALLTNRGNRAIYATLKTTNLFNYFEEDGIILNNNKMGLL